MMFSETDRGVRTFAVVHTTVPIHKNKGTENGRESITVHLLLRLTDVNLLSNSLKMNVNEDLGTRMTAFIH